jgi:branched-chain amino acid aminotransferase
MTTIFLNGDYVEDNVALISHKDCGFTTGIGIFDSMLAIDGKLIHDPDHYERILHDTKIIIGIDLSFSFEDFKNTCFVLLEKNDLSTGHARIRTTITGGKVDVPLAAATSPTILIDAASCSPAPETPLSCAIVRDYPRVAGSIFENCKRLDYSRSYAARRQAESLGAQEAILTNTMGNIACGATSNLFIEENGILITPPLSDGVLAGVTRKNIIIERNAKEQSVSFQRLQAADNVFLTNSFIGLRKVRVIS